MNNADVSELPSNTVKERTTASRLSWKIRLSISLQHAVSLLTALLWLPLLILVARYGFGWRIRNLKALRQQYKNLRGRGPVLLCANHLTMLDSAVIALALGSPAWYLRHFAAFAWNVPEQENFSAQRWKRVACYLLKCIPISRGGQRESIAATLKKLIEVLHRNQTLLIFPEGGRSRSGRVDSDNPAYGIGRILSEVPACRVLCLYVRGDHQQSWSDLPMRNETFTLRLRGIQPQTEKRGLRGSADLTRQILSQLQHMEEAHFQQLESALT
jgi:1-acyl-sn-glycerol-3-phosphate acyltransferase